MKPISFLDLESTGTDRKTARIVEIAIVRVNLDGSRDSFSSLVNPGIPIPAEASAIHGITDDMVKDAPALSTIIPIITSALEGSDIGGFNSNNYDIPLLYLELARCGYNWNLSDVSFIDVCTVFKRKEERTLSAAVKFYCGREHEGAHGAIADVNATIDVFISQLGMYEDIRTYNNQQISFYCNYDKPRADLDGKFTVDNDGDYVFTFGKHKGIKAKSPECKDYLAWMISGDFLPDTKDLATLILATPK